MLRFRPLALVALACSLGAAGCSPAPPTMLVVVVDTDYAIPAGIDEMTIDVRGPDGVHHVEHEPMASASQLPYTLTVLPTGSALGPIEIEASGSLGGSVIVTREARVMLVQGQSLMVRLDLLRVCALATVSCADAEQTCDATGRCVSVDVEATRWTGTPTRLTDAGTVTSGDGGRDAAAGDGGATEDAAMAEDAGVIEDAAAGPDTGPCVVDGAACGTTTCGPLGTCTAPPGSPACARTGEQTRTCTDRVCMSGACVDSPRVEVVGCVVRDGATCMPTSCDVWSGSCPYVGSCTSPGNMQTRPCNDYTCAMGFCVSMPRTEMRACPPATSGTSCIDRSTQCGSYQCNASGACVQIGTCALARPYCCTVTDPATCVAGASQCNAT